VKRASSKLDHFTDFVLENTFAFFASKLINPYRKCDLYQDLLNKSKKYTTDTEKKQIELTLELVQRNRPLEELILNCDLSTLFYSSRYLGNFLGDTLYNEHYTADSLLPSRDFDQMIKILLSPLSKIEDFKLLLDIVLPLDKYHLYRKRIF